MYFKDHNYILKLSILFGYIFVILFFFSGRAHDAINYLNLRAGTEILRFSTDRTDITFLLIYPFSLFGVYIGGILYISFSRYQQLKHTFGPRILRYHFDVI